MLIDLKIQVGSVVNYETTEDGWTKSSQVKGIKDNKAILFSGNEIDINNLEPQIISPTNYVWVIKGKAVQIKQLQEMFKKAFS